MNVTIEHASRDDLAILARIEGECFKEEAFSKHQIAYLLNDYNSICLVAKEHDQIIGFIIGTIYIDKTSPTGHILTIDVLPQHRRKQIGILLLQEMEKLFRGKGVKTSLLEVKEDNIAAMKLYEKLGYRKIARLKNYYAGADGLHLTKELT